MLVNKVPPNFEILGCPVGNGGAECSRGCGGWYRISTAALTQAFLSGTLNPNLLCGPLTDRINAANELIQTLNPSTEV